MITEPEYRYAMRIINLIIGINPEVRPDCPMGRLLVRMADAVEEFEQHYFPIEDNNNERPDQPAARRSQVARPRG